jgi:hypothetical protein
MSIVSEEQPKARLHLVTSRVSEREPSSPPHSPNTPTLSNGPTTFDATSTMPRLRSLMIKAAMLAEHAPDKILALEALADVFLERASADAPRQHVTPTPGWKGRRL